MSADRDNSRMEVLRQYEKLQESKPAAVKPQRQSTGVHWIIIIVTKMIRGSINIALYNF